MLKGKLYAMIELLEVRSPENVFFDTFSNKIGLQLWTQFKKKTFYNIIDNLE